MPITYSIEATSAAEHFDPLKAKNCNGDLCHLLKIEVYCPLRPHNFVSDVGSTKTIRTKYECFKTQIIFVFFVLVKPTSIKSSLWSNQHRSSHPCEDDEHCDLLLLTSYVCRCWSFIRFSNTCS